MPHKSSKKGRGRFDAIGSHFPKAFFSNFYFLFFISNSTCFGKQAGGEKPV